MQYCFEKSAKSGVEVGEPVISKAIEYKNLIKKYSFSVSVYTSTHL